MTRKPYLLPWKNPFGVTTLIVENFTELKDFAWLALLMTSMWQTPYPDKYITRIYLFMYLSEYGVCHIDVISSARHAKSLSFVKFSTIRLVTPNGFLQGNKYVTLLKKEQNKEPRSSLYLEQFGNVSHLHLQQVQISKRGRAVVEYMNI